MTRPLDDFEIRQLEQQGCRADDWSAVTVSERFRPETVERVRFCGHVELGAFERPVELEPGLSLPSGVSDAVLFDCAIGDNCLVRQVGCYLHGYRLDEGAVVMNCGTLTTTADAEFGMDGALAPAHDDEPRLVAVCDGLQAPMAALMLTQTPAATAMRRLAARRAVAWAGGERGIIGRKAVVANTTRLANTYVGDASEVNGASVLNECALLSTEEAPIWVGAGVVAEETVVGAGSTLDGSTHLYNCYVGEYIRMRGLRAARRFFFAETPPDDIGFPLTAGERLDRDGWTPERPATDAMTPMDYDTGEIDGTTDEAARERYLLDLLAAYSHTPAGRADDFLPRSTDGPGEWTAPGGRAMPVSVWENWQATLAAGGYASFEEAADALGDIARQRSQHLWAWAYARLLKRYGLDSLTEEAVRTLLTAYT